jgi:hypothetical protein
VGNGKVRASQSDMLGFHKDKFLAAGLLLFVIGLSSTLTLLAGRGREASAPWPGIGYLARAGVNADRMGLPRVMFWAWERPEDLRFLDSRDAGVAFLAGTIYLTSPQGGAASSPADGVTFRPRMQPLRVQPGTPLMAVIRIETPNDLWHAPPKQTNTAAPTETPAKPYTVTQLQIVARLITSVATLPGVKALQIDYDASRSERGSYAELLQDVRRQMPRGMPLSITALASWCIGDPWLEKLPPGTIDEAVPMLFRMGPDTRHVAEYLQSGREFGSAVCRGSLGVSTDEPLSQSLLSGAIPSSPARRSSNRIYVFLPHPWTNQDAQTVNEEMETWHNE